MLLARRRISLDSRFVRVMPAKRQVTPAIAIVASARTTRQYRIGDVRHITADSSLLRKEFAWQPEVSFADGMAEMAGQ